jgi:hypothetical protein
MATFKCIGVYRIIPTKESIINAAQFHQYKWLLDNTLKYFDEIEWENHRNLTLIEIQVSGDFTTDLLQTIFQSNITSGDQAPYMEYYLDPMGIKLLSEQEAVNMDNRRICFFLHFTNTDNPLNINDIEIELQSVSDLPGRLQSFTHYIPAD